MTFFVIMLLIILFIIITLIKPRCQDCGSKLDDIDMCDEHIIYKCRNCGEEWI